MVSGFRELAHARVVLLWFGGNIYFISWANSDWVLVATWSFVFHKKNSEATCGLWEIETLSMSSIWPGMRRGSSSTLEFFPCSVKCCFKCFFWGGQSKPPLYLFLYIYLLIYFLFADIHMHLFFLTLFLVICFSCFLAGEIYRQGEYFLGSHETQRWQLNLYGLTESYSSEEGKGSQVGKKEKVKCLVPFKKV